MKTKITTVFVLLIAYACGMLADQENRHSNNNYNHFENEQDKQYEYQTIPVTTYGKDDYHKSQEKEYGNTRPNYEFNYSVNNVETGDKKSHYEIRDGDNVKGMYTVLDADGYNRIVEYTADKINGFRANVRREATDQFDQHNVKNTKGHVIYNPTVPAVDIFGSNKRYQNHNSVLNQYTTEQNKYSNKYSNVQEIHDHYNPTVLSDTFTPIDNVNHNSELNQYSNKYVSEHTNHVLYRPIVAPVETLAPTEIYVNQNSEANKYITNYGTEHKNPSVQTLAPIGRYENHNSESNKYSTDHNTHDYYNPFVSNERHENHNSRPNKNSNKDVSEQKSHVLYNLIQQSDATFTPIEGYVNHHAEPTNYNNKNISEHKSHVIYNPTVASVETFEPIERHEHYYSDSNKYSKKYGTDHHAHNHNNPTVQSENNSIESYINPNSEWNTINYKNAAVESMPIYVNKVKTPATEVKYELPVPEYNYATVVPKIEFPVAAQSYNYDTEEHDYKHYTETPQYKFEAPQYNYDTNVSLHKYVTETPQYQDASETHQYEYARAEPQHEYVPEYKHVTQTPDSQHVTLPHRYETGTPIGRTPSKSSGSHYGTPNAQEFVPSRENNYVHHNQGFVYGH